MPPLLSKIIEKETDSIERKELIKDKPMAFCDCSGVKEYSLSEWLKLRGAI